VGSQAQKGPVQIDQACGFTMKKILEQIKRAQASLARRKKFEKMKQQLATPVVRRPAAKSVAKR